MSGLYIAKGGVKRGCIPTSTCAYCAREGLWQQCVHCHVTYYCTQSCRDNHYSEHVEYCSEVATKRHFIQQGIYSLRKLIQDGNVIRISYTGE
jgi:hypothetical protein